VRIGLTLPSFKDVIGAPHRLALAVRDNLAAEQDRWFGWTVAAFVAGAVVYFALPSEVALWGAAVVAASGILIGAIGLSRANSVLRFACVLLASVALGFFAAKLRTESVDAPIIQRDIGPLWIDGRIESVAEQGNGRSRIVVMPARMGRSKEDLPRRLRVTMPANKVPAAMTPGSWYSLLAMVKPPPEPALPHGYDFARWAYFSGIGGVGFVLGTPKPIAPVADDSWWQSFMASIQRLRLSMTARIRAALPGPEGSIAAALITGERGPITDADNAAYRDSGLQHVLSISGLHMALAGLGIFWVLRALLALWPLVALTQPIKKWAAVAALASSTFYLLLSGASAPPVRAYIMLACMLIAVLVDRPALSMRAVAMAALLIIAVEPESVVEPGFQMSFAAIVGLIALAEWAANRPRNDAPVSTLWRATRATGKYFGGGMVASLVAGFATAPFAIFHFNRAAGYSLLSNILALPVIGIVIMPAAAVAVVMMPFGLEYWPLQAMGWGIRVMTGIAYWVASLPGAVNLVPAWPDAALILMALGGLWIGLWQRRWRWLGVAPIAAGCAFALTAVAPDVIVARDARSAAVRGDDGALRILGKPDDYSAEQWLRRDGDIRAPAEAQNADRCDEWGCVARGAQGRLAALSLRPGALTDDCVRADIVVSAVPIRQDCPRAKVTVDRIEVARGGAIALWFDNGVVVRRESVAEVRGKRPWSSGQYRRNRPTRQP
jgi:competence protein ComEC